MSIIKILMWANRIVGIFIFFKHNDHS